MRRRVTAWVLLIGFILLLLNIIAFHILLIPSVSVYVIIAIWFVFNNKPLPSRKKKANPENQESTEEESGDESGEKSEEAAEEKSEERSEE